MLNSSCRPLRVTATQALPVQPGAGSKSEVFARSAPTIDDTVLQHSKPGAEISLIMPRDVGEAHEDTSELQRRRLSSFFTSSRKGFKRLEKLTEEDSVGGTTSLSDSPSLASVENTLDEAVAPISWEDLEKDKWGYPLADTPIDVLPEHMQREVRQKYGHWYNAKIRTDQSGSYHYEGWPWPKPKVSEEAA